MGVLLNQKTYLKSVDMLFPKQTAIDPQSGLWNEILHIIEAWGTANLSDQSWGSKKNFLCIHIFGYENVSPYIVLYSH